MDKVQFSDPLFFLKNLGLSPFQNDSFAKMRTFLAVVVYCLVVSSGILEVFLNFNSIGIIIRAFEVMFSYYQFGWKFFVLINYRKQLAELIESSSQFWDLRELGDIHKIDNYQNHRFLKKSLRGYIAGMAFSGFQYILAATFTEEPMVISFGETQGLSHKARYTYLILHFIFLFMVLNLTSGFDGLFFYLIGHILSELKMVKIAFGQEKIHPRWNYKERFKKALMHHIFVLKFIQGVNQIYSMMLLHLNISFLFGLCFSSFLLIADGVPPDFQHLSKFLPYIAVVLGQTWMYCFAGNLISDWSLEIADQIFYEDWSLDRAYDKKLDKIIILKRAQRPATLTLGGFRNMDLTCFTLVNYDHRYSMKNVRTIIVKNAASFFTFMNTMVNA